MKRLSLICSISLSFGCMPAGTSGSGADGVVTADDGGGTASDGAGGADAGACDGIKDGAGTCYPRCSSDDDCDIDAGQSCQPAPLRDGTQVNICRPSLSGIAAAGAGPASCSVADGPGIVEPIDDSTQAANCASACTWLAGCAVNSGACTGYDTCDTASYDVVYSDCIETCQGPTGSALLQLAKNHTTCAETITLVSGANECLKALCTAGAIPGDNVPACNTDDASVDDASAGADADAAPTMTIAEIAAGTDSVSTLLNLVVTNAPDLAGSLGDSALNFTVFAPTNDAFAQLSATPEGDALLNVLRSHIIENSVAKSTDLRDGMDIGTAGTGRIKVSITEGTVTLTMGETTATVIAADIMATNGVVHLIDTVLIPSE